MKLMTNVSETFQEFYFHGCNILDILNFFKNAIKNKLKYLQFFIAF